LAIIAPKATKVRSSAAFFASGSDAVNHFTMEQEFHHGDAILRRHGDSALERQNARTPRTSELQNVRTSERQNG
jgi:hypothetical protein